MAVVVVLNAAVVADLMLSTGVPSGTVRRHEGRRRVEASGNSAEDPQVPSLVEAIPRLNVEDGAELRVAHTETHSWSIDVTGTIWARKRVEVTGIEGLLAEAVSWLLARRLCVPVPDAAVTLSGDLSWLSKQITPVVHWDAIHQGGITNLMDLGKVLVLDVLINNPDRHAGNLLLQPDPDESAIKLWAIDAGNALIGWPSDYAAARDDLPSLRNLARGLPVSEVRESALEAAEVASTISTLEIVEMVVHACHLANEPQPELITTTLVSRCARARELTDEYLMRIGATR